MPITYMYAPSRVSFSVYATLVCVLLFGAVGKGFGQDKVRKYANFQGTLQAGTQLTIVKLKGTVDNASSAVDGNPQSSSQLAISLSAVGTATATQFLAFSSNGDLSGIRTFNANVPMIVKFSLPSSILGVAGASLKVGYYTGLHTVSSSWPILGSGHDAGYDATKTEVYNDASLLSLLSAAGTVEVNVIPNVAYQGIYIELEAGVLGINPSVNLHHAYILEDYSYTNCSKNNAIDVLSGVRAGAIGGIANATGTVSNPWNVIDSDHATYALMSTGAQVLSEVYLNTIFATPSASNQKVSILIQDPGAALLDLNLLAGFTIQPYLGSVAVGSPISNSSDFLSLRLLAGAGNIYELQSSVSGSFDRVEIKMGGVATALTQLKIYEVSRLPLSPEITTPNGQPSDETVCEGQTATFQVAATVPTNNLTYQWQYYNGTEWAPAENNNDAATYTILNTPLSYNNRKYRVAITGGNSDCLQTITSSEALLTVHPKPNAPTLNINPHSQY